MRIAVFCALVAFACAAPVPPAASQQQVQQPSKPADIRGTITKASAAQITVEAEPKEFRGGKAVVTITGTTAIRDAAGKTVAASALREGQRVQVWFGGAVAQSYPLQAEAVTIVVE